MSRILVSKCRPAFGWTHQRFSPLVRFGSACSITGNKQSACTCFRAQNQIISINRFNTLIDSENDSVSDETENMIKKSKFTEYDSNWSTLPIVSGKGEKEAMDILKHFGSELDTAEFELFVASIFKTLEYEVEFDSNGRTVTVNDGNTRISSSNKEIHLRHFELKVEHPLHGNGIVNVIVTVSDSQTEELEFEYCFLVTTLGTTAADETSDNSVDVKENKFNQIVMNRSELIQTLQDHKTEILLKYDSLIRRYYNQQKDLNELRLNESHLNKKKDTTNSLDGFLLFSLFALVALVSIGIGAADKEAKKRQQQAAHKEEKESKEIK